MKEAPTEISNKEQINFKVKQCDFCKEQILNIEPIECIYCHGKFCLKHRIESDHKCRSKQTTLSTQDKIAQMRDLAKQKLAEAKKRSQNK